MEVKATLSKAALLCNIDYYSAQEQKLIQQLSKVDAEKKYWQNQLADESGTVCAMLRPRGVDRSSEVK
jgi:hypothetical protein